MDISHIKMLEYEETIGPYLMPKVALFNGSKLTADEAFRIISAGDYNDHIVILEKRQWISLFKNGNEA